MMAVLASCAVGEGMGIASGCAFVRRLVQTTAQAGPAASLETTSVAQAAPSRQRQELPSSQTHACLHSSATQTAPRRGQSASLAALSCRPPARWPRRPHCAMSLAPCFFSIAFQAWDCF